VNREVKGNKILKGINLKKIWDQVQEYFRDLKITFATNQVFDGKKAVGDSVELIKLVEMVSHSFAISF